MGKKLFTIFAQNVCLSESVLNLAYCVSFFV